LGQLCTQKNNHENLCGISSPEISGGIRDAYIQYVGLKPWGMPLKIIAGNFKQPFGLEDQLTFYHYDGKTADS
jgi:hypothetical protein